MAEYPTLTRQDLANHTSRPLASFKENQVTTALTLATLLFKISTCRKAFPDDPDEAALAKAALLSYADHIILAMPYAKAAASPFSSESLGSYSYSKSAAAAARGDKTGVFWFDLAVERLGQCDLLDDVLDFGGVEIFEHDASFVDGSTGGNIRMLSPQDIEISRMYGYDPVLSRN